MDRQTPSNVGRRAAAVWAGVAAALVAAVAAFVIVALWRPWKRRSGRQDVFVTFVASAPGLRATIRVRRIHPSVPGTLVDEGADAQGTMATLVMQRPLLAGATDVEVVPEEVILEASNGSAARLRFALGRVEERTGDGTWAWVADVPGCAPTWTLPVRPTPRRAPGFLHLVFTLDRDALRGCCPTEILQKSGGRLWGGLRAEMRPNRLLTPMPVRTPTWAPDDEPACARRIPPRVFQTFRRIDGQVPVRMRKVMRRWGVPGLEHYFFDDDACRAMIARHFRPGVLRAYDTLVPTAFKADLWRACALFLYGGFYFDVKVTPARGVRLLHEVGPEVDVLLATDIPVRPSVGGQRDAMWNAVMGFRRGHPMLRVYIDAIVDNVDRRLYGSTPLDITGPRLLGKVFSEWYGMGGGDLRSAGPARALDGKDGRQDMVLLWHMGLALVGGPVTVFADSTRGRAVLRGEYSGYRSDQREFESVPHYGQLWRQRRVYLTPSHE